MDCVLVSASSSSKAFQGLAKRFSAIEPPTWSLLLAESCRAKGFEVSIIDAEAEGLSDDMVSERLKTINPKLILFVVYGANPNAGTTGMIGAIRCCKHIRETGIKNPVCFVGSHVSALPKEVISIKEIDFILLNEGVYALHNLIRELNKKEPSFKNVKGIAFKENGSYILNEPEKIVPQSKMDEDLPGYAWDLLPFKEKPLDLYRAHFWHAEFKDENRTPFASIYTSLGCVFGCEFCMINILNRTDNSDEITAQDSSIMRFWSKEWIFRQFDILHSFGVKTLRFADEMFFFKRDVYIPICEYLIEKNYKFNIWAYARVDTVKKIDLELFKKAGINWLCLGIEAANRNVRLEISKGSFKDTKVDEVVELIKNSGISVLGNYIFGFPYDTKETMQETLELALKLKCEHANFYACTALPGSSLYYQSKQKGWYVPEYPNYEEFAFLSYEHHPLPTNTCTASEVLEFRDTAWNIYFSDKNYHKVVKDKFGDIALKNLTSMAGIKLKRKLLEKNIQK